MPLFIPDTAYQAYFDYFAACTRLSLVSDELVPVNLENELVAKTLTAGAGNGDYSIDAGDPDGRKLVVAEQNDVEATGTGITRQAVLSLGGAIRLVTDCSERSLNHTEGDKVNMSSFELEVGGPQLPI